MAKKNGATPQEPQRYVAVGKWVVMAAVKRETKIHLLGRAARNTWAEVTSVGNEVTVVKPGDLVIVKQGPRKADKLNDQGTHGVVHQDDICCVVNPDVPIAEDMIEVADDEDIHGIKEGAWIQ